MARKKKVHEETPNFMKSFLVGPARLKKGDAPRLKNHQFHRGEKLTPPTVRGSWLLYTAASSKQIPDPEPVF